MIYFRERLLPIIRHIFPWRQKTVFSKFPIFKHPGKNDENPRFPNGFHIENHAIFK